MGKLERGSNDLLRYRCDNQLALSGARGRAGVDASGGNGVAVMFEFGSRFVNPPLKPPPKRNRRSEGKRRFGSAILATLL